MCSNREEEIDTLDYDSKRVTGFVGLSKQKFERKAYLNSLLQVLFHLPCFRRAVHQIPNVNAASIVSLKTLFRKIEDGDTTVSMLLKMPGSNLKNEIQALCEEIEEATVGEKTIRKLFEGHFVECCTNVEESFTSLDLEAKNCSDVYSSFDKFVEEKRFFTLFPPILQLQLQDTTMKVNDRYDYPLELNLDRDNRKYLSTKADKSTSNVYTLHSVICHNEDRNCFALIRPKLSDLWLKFEDELVTIVDAEDEQSGRHGNASEKATFSQPVTGGEFKLKDIEDW